MRVAELSAVTSRLAKPPRPAETSTRSPGASVVTPAPTATTVPADSVPGTKGTAGLIWYCPATKRAST